MASVDFSDLDIERLSSIFCEILEDDKNSGEKPSFPEESTRTPEGNIWTPEQNPWTQYESDWTRGQDFQANIEQAYNTDLITMNPEDASTTSMEQKMYDRYGSVFDWFNFGPSRVQEPAIKPASTTTNMHPNLFYSDTNEWNEPSGAAPSPTAPLTSQVEPPPGARQAASFSSPENTIRLALIELWALIEPNGSDNHHQAQKPEKARRRVLFSSPQVGALQRHFLRQKYLDRTEMGSLADEIGLTYTQVKTWFQNRRGKQRKWEKRCKWEAVRTARINNAAVSTCPSHIQPPQLMMHCNQQMPLFAGNPPQHHARESTHMQWPQNGAAGGGPQSYGSQLAGPSLPLFGTDFEVLSSL